MIKLISTNAEGLYASPDHPITCANPAPWKITEMKVEIHSYDRSTDSFISKVWIRGEHSIWFRADQCQIGTKEELS